MHKGSCLCSGVKYQIQGDIESSCNCHCSMCQKHNGSAFGSYGNVRVSNFTLVSGEDLLESYESSPGVHRVFCRRCGSSLTWHSEHKFSNYISVALGTLDTRYEGPAVKNIFIENKACWLVSG